MTGPDADLADFVRSRRSDLGRTERHDFRMSIRPRPADVDPLIDDLLGGSGAVLSEEDRQKAPPGFQKWPGITPEEAVSAPAEEFGREAAARVERSVEAARQRATSALPVPSILGPGAVHDDGPSVVVRASSPHCEGSSQARPSPLEWARIWHRASSSARGSIGLRMRGAAPAPPGRSICPP